MNRIKELCKLIFALPDASEREIASLHGEVAPNTVGRYKSVIEARQLSWHDIHEMDEIQLDDLLNPVRTKRRCVFVEPDWSEVHQTMQLSAGTLVVEHHRYENNADGMTMSLSEFQRRYKAYYKSLALSMRMVHRPGEKIFVDYSGKKAWLFDQSAGKPFEVEIFVAVCGASSKVYAEASLTQRVPDWIDSHTRMLKFFGGVTKYIVPDNLKSAVISHTKKGGVILNRTYADFGDYHNTLIHPARPYKPKDKGKVEVGVKIVQRWILMLLRKRTFFSLAALNAAIWKLLEDINNRPMRRRQNKSRNELFTELDRPALKPLKERDYDFATWYSGITVPDGYHIAHAGHYYSVPYHLVGKKIELRVSAQEVRIQHASRVVATHPLSHKLEDMSTIGSHRPKNHQMYAEDCPDDLFEWAEQAGAGVSAFVRRHREINRAPNCTFQAVRGLKQLARDCGVPRLNQACTRALLTGGLSLKSLRSVLQYGLENDPMKRAEHVNPVSNHEYVRGPHYA